MGCRNWIFKIFAMAILIANKHQIQASVGKCCDQGYSIGKKVVEYGVGCTSSSLDMSKIQIANARICTSVFTSCCRNGAMRGFCTEGVRLAMSDLRCTANPLIGGDQQRTCCQCCTGGIKVGKAGGDCDVKKGSPLCSESFQSCCKAQSKIVKTTVATTTATDAKKNTLSPITIATTAMSSNVTNLPKLLCSDVRCSDTCVMTNDGPKCKCSDGYQLDKDGLSCIDKDECLEVNACADKQLCLNIKGSHICLTRCPYGYAVVDRRCEDVDECKLGQSRCSSRYRCVNTVGSYRCQRQSCPSGFRMTQDRCVDVNECSENKRICGDGGVCYNQYGSYYCLCRRGYKKNEVTGKCVDRDECSEKVDSCDYKCINTPGSFECRCPNGYKTSRSRCIDENECQNGKARCPDGYSCFNNFGSYSCVKNTCPNKHYVQKTEQECKLFCMVRGQCKYHLEQSIKWQAFRYRKIVKAEEFQFTYIVRVKAYFIRPTITFYLHSGNEDGKFAVERIDAETAKVVNIKDLSGPKTYQLRLHADISYNGRTTTRFVYFFYVYVSSYNF